MNDWPSIFAADYRQLIAFDLGTKETPPHGNVSRLPDKSVI